MKSAGKWPFVVAAVVFVSPLLLWRLQEPSKPHRLSEKIQFTDGKHQKHYPNGTLQGEWTYKDDKLHGRASSIIRMEN